MGGKVTPSASGSLFCFNIGQLPIEKMGVAYKAILYFKICLRAEKLKLPNPHTT